MTSDERDGLVALKETDKLVDDLAQSCLHPCPSSLVVLLRDWRDFGLAVFGEQIVKGFGTEIVDGCVALQREALELLSDGIGHVKGNRDATVLFLARVRGFGLGFLRRFPRGCGGVRQL